MRILAKVITIVAIVTIVATLLFSALVAISDLPIWAKFFLLF